MFLIENVVKSNRLGFATKYWEDVAWTVFFPYFQRIAFNVLSPTLLLY